MKKTSTRIDKSGKQWDNYKVGDVNIQTCTSKKGDIAVFGNGKKLNPKKKI